MGQWPVEGQVAPQGHCSTSPPPPAQIGVLPPTPRPTCGGTSRGFSAASSTSPFTLPVSLTGEEGGVCPFFYFWFFCLLRLFVFKDAAGQTGREGVCLPIRLRGLRRGSLGQAETSCNTVFPGWWPEDVCNSRGQVIPLTLASAPPSALLPTSSLPCPSLMLVSPFLKLPPRVSEASLGWGRVALSACLRRHAVLDCQ